MPIDSLGDLLQPATWATWVYVSARLVGVMLVAPTWRLLPVPMTVRALVVVIWSACLVPGASAAGVFDAYELQIIPLATELGVGILIGTVPLLLLGVASLAGDVVGLQSGLTLGGALSPSIRELGAGWGEWFGWLALAVFMVMRGDLLLLEALGNSVHLIPPGMPWNMDAGVTHAIELPLQIVGLGVQFAAPIIVALFIANLGLGLLNRAIPQLNVMMAAFPITIATALLIGAIGTPVFVRAFAELTERMPAIWAALLDGMVAG